MHTARRSLVYTVFLLLLGLAGSTSASDTRQPTHEFTLDNGLKVIVREDHRAPVVVSQLWYRVGSSYEPPGRTGLSHALEHMMFKGSERLAPGQASRLLSSLGAQENAFTSRDYTAYYQILSRDQLAIALELEAERMHNLTLPEDEFLREMEVIKEERRLRVDDNPNSLAYERFLSQAYMASPYAQPVIGWMHDLDRLTVEDMRNWYDLYYQPSNAVLVIVGDVQLEEVRSLVDRYFAPLSNRPVPEQRAPLELPGGAERSLTLRLPVQMPSLLLGFNVPSLTTAEQAADVHALRLLAAVLDGGYSARLATHLERGESVATSASAHYDGFARGDSLFLLSGIPNQSRDISLEQLEQALWQQIEQLQQTPPSPEELNRVQAQMTAQLVYAQDSISHQANRIGMLESIGLPWTLLDEDIDALQNITPEQISDVARRYLVPERLTRAEVLPAVTEEAL
ncbi:M16 family metallopeptidase [Halopseudomonas pertucinogena]|uniref:Zinc protease n=1 Tax=Halopseudomonas pertucinogena TaxID=86175 RepID=A0ABQ2CSR6_9GAMM|nr:pitrilysin family protein [Halopseudomonas pertucinogena]GGJ07695.1 zinc protease [Halopseudomonas pertucinogena]